LTSSGGNSDPNYCVDGSCGVAYKIDTSTGKESTIYRFCSQPNCADGGVPSFGGLTLGANGVLYGTLRNNGPIALTPPTGKKSLWTEMLFPFPGGGYSLGNLVYDPDANVLRGTTYETGREQSGTLFELDLATSAITTLYTFNEPKTGGYPNGGLVMNNGLLYGTTSEGSKTGGGTIFVFDPATGTLTTLHRFCSQEGCSDGGFPVGPIIIQQGTLYGTTIGVEPGSPYGTVYAFSLSTNTLSVLHSFTNGADGGTPTGGVSFDNTGILYGTTSQGGTRTGGSPGYGTVFSLNPTSQALTTLHTFGFGRDGAYPYAQLAYAAGAFYGTTTAGGACENCGTVFKLTP
jgi:uncharacterized repeat protein (TIGR03803 family)